MLAEIAGGTWSRHPSPGDGDDHRLRHERLTGSALVWDDRSVVHMQVFPEHRRRSSFDEAMAARRIRTRYRARRDPRRERGEAAE